MDIDRYFERISGGAYRATVELWALIAVGAFVLGALGAGWVFQSSMEARAYNRITGSDVSTWEAMWVELRVQDSPERE